MSSPTPTGTPFFTIPVPSAGKQPAGFISVSELAPLVYLLVMDMPADNRLSSASCGAFLDALDMLEFGGYERGVLVTTSAIPKFYSNGLDLEHALATPTFLPEKLFRLFGRLIAYPMPTIALINGHAFAGGLMLAMHHDYRIMNPTKGFLCVNELEFGVPLKPGMAAVFRLKLAPAVYRQLVLEAHRFSGPAALSSGLVDGLGALPETLSLVEERKLSKMARSGIYGIMKAEMYRETVDGYLSEKGHVKEEERWKAMQKAEKERAERGRQRVRELSKAFGAKL